MTRLPRVLLASAALAACWLLLPVNDAGFDRYHLPKELWLQLSALLSLVLLAQRRQPLVWDAVTKLTLLLGAVSIASTLAATSPQLSLRGVSLELSAIVLFLAARSLTEGACTRSWLVLALLGVASLAGAEIFGLVTQLSRTGRAPGASLGQRNMVAHLLALGAPCAFALLDSPRRARRLLASVASVLLTLVVVHTRSRAGWLALAAGLLLFELGSARGVRRGLPSLLCALGVVLALLLPTRLVWSSATPYRDSLSHLLDTQQGSGRGRLAQYRSSLAMLSDDPLLGVGPGNWLVHYPALSPPGDPAFRAHTFLNTGRLINSDLLALLVEQGPLALLLTLLLIGALLRRVQGSPDRALVWGTLAAGAVAGSLDAVLQLPAAACWAALGLGSAQLDARPAPTAGEGAERGRWWPLVSALPIVLLVLMIAASVLSTGRLLALWQRTRPAGGYGSMERALAWNPHDLTARFALAEAYLLAGDCSHARPHVAALRELLPYHPAPREMESACAGQ